MNRSPPQTVGAAGALLPGMAPKRAGYDGRVDEHECPGHVWLLEEIETGSPQTPPVFQCMNCGAVRR